MRGIELIAPDLADKVTKAPRPLQQALAVRACELAMNVTGLSDPVAVSALQQLKDNRAVETALLRGLVERMDGAALQILDAVAEGRTDSVEYYRAFALARAANALLLAESDVGETLYEANAAIDDVEAIRDLINTTLT